MSAEATNPETDDDYEARQLVAIEAWRNEPPTILGKAIGIVAKPLSWTIGKVVPVSAIAGLLRGADWLARKSLDDEWILKKANVSSVEELRGLPLRQLDEIADGFHDWAVGMATAEGGATGFFGLPGIAADIPAVVALALRTIRGVGACYGYAGNDDVEREFVLSILSAAGANSVGERTASVVALREIEVMVARETFKAMARKASEAPVSKAAAVMAARDFAKRLGINLTKRKLAQAIPVVGLVVGAATNGMFLGDVGWAARRSYQSRLLAERRAAPAEVAA